MRTIFFLLNPLLRWARTRRFSLEQKTASVEERSRFGGFRSGDMREHGTALDQVF